MEVDALEKKIDKNQTGIASELYVAAELFRRKWDVTISFGATKSFDLLAKKGETLIAVQVKGIHYTKSGNWNIDAKKLDSEKNLFIVFVNLHSDNLSTRPEFFVLSKYEVRELIISKNKLGLDNKRPYIQYSTLKNMNFKDKWDKLEQAIDYI